MMIYKLNKCPPIFQLMFATQLLRALTIFFFLFHFVLGGRVQNGRSAADATLYNEWLKVWAGIDHRKPNE